MSTNLHQPIAEARQADLARQTRYAHHTSRPAPDQDKTTSNTKLKLIALATRIAVFALPIAEVNCPGFRGDWV